MKNNIPFLENYLNSYLSPLLFKLGVSEKFIKKIIDNIRIQIYSFCFHWDEVKYRNGLLVVGLEEGFFYEPKHPINPFIVVAIRNSLIESIQSEDYKKTGLHGCLQNDSIKAITNQAIEYFCDLNMEQISQNIQMDCNDDYYGIVNRKYPLAWEALMEIGNSKSNAIIYPPIKFKHSPDIFSCLKADVMILRSSVVILDGYDTQIDENLKNVLSCLMSQKDSFFFVESFKTLTRNYEKLLFIMEFVLFHKKPFVTCNYYITNGYVAKRSFLLRPGHTTIETNENIKNLTGIRKTHRDTIKKIIL